MSTGDATNVERVRYGSAAGLAGNRSKAAVSAPRNTFLQPLAAWQACGDTRTNSKAGPNKPADHKLLGVLICIRSVVYGNAQCCQQHCASVWEKRIRPYSYEHGRQTLKDHLLM